MSWLSDIARPEILALKAYEHASWEPHYVRLHANESPWRSPADSSAAGLNRYPEPHPFEFEARLAAHYGVPANHLLAGRGSDEGIDLLVRSFCRAGQDAVLIAPPTFGIYAVAANIQGARIIRVPLQRACGFAFDVDAVLAARVPELKLVFACNPNNPTGTLATRGELLRLARALEGQALLVVDEAYVEFAAQHSLADQVDSTPSLVVLRTLSKAHGLAGARCGAVIAQPEVIHLLRKVIQPYAITQLTIEAVTAALRDAATVSAERVRQLIAERERMSLALAALPAVDKVWPSAANYLLAEFADPVAALKRAHNAGLLVRDFSGTQGLQRALRISMGTPEQNNQLLAGWA